MLTVKELKALEVGDWVWIVVLQEDRINKAHHGKYYHIHQLLDSLADKELWCGWQGYSTAFKYTDYGTKWLAYKNKEEAEGKSITLSCKVGDTVYTTFCGAYSWTVQRIDIYKDKILMRLGNEGTEDYSCVNLKYLGEDWFLTKEEAQAAYKNRINEIQNKT